jgi:hypothetical protein
VHGVVKASFERQLIETIQAVDYLIMSSRTDGTLQPWILPEQVPGNLPAAGWPAMAAGLQAGAGLVGSCTGELADPQLLFDREPPKD